MVYASHGMYASQLASENCARPHTPLATFAQTISISASRISSRLRTRIGTEIEQAAETDPEALSEKVHKQRNLAGASGLEDDGWSL